MTDTTKYPESDASSMKFQIAFRDDVTQADRQNAERSVATLVGVLRRQSQGTVLLKPTWRS